MTTSTNNSWTSQLVTRLSLDAEMAKAKTSHHNAKTQALETVVSLYGLYLATMGPNAPKQGRKWLDDKIEAANIAIDNLNKAKRNGEPSLMRVEARDKASKFTTLVKLTLEVRDPKEASIVSRYCKALEAIDKEYAGKQIGSPREITTWGTAKGGFEVLVLMGRGEDGQQPKTNDDSDAAAAVVAAAIKAEIQNRQPVGQFPAPAGVADGLVLAVGRQINGQIEVVSSAPLPDNTAWVSFFESDLGPKLDPTTAFAAQVQSLGTLVQEGRLTERTVNDTPGAPKLKEERAFTMIPEAGNLPTLMVSARLAKASIIIKAKPTDPAIQLGSPTDTVIMKRESEVALRTTLSGKYATRMVKVMASTDKDGLPTWKTEPSSLSKATTVAEYCWDPVAGEPHMPLSVGDFRPQFAVDLALSELVRLHDERLKVWIDREKAARLALAAAKRKSADGTVKKKPKAEGPKTRISLKFESGKLTFSLPHNDDLVLAVNGSVTKAVTMAFRPYDLLNVAAKLRQQNAKSFKLEGDTRGLLRFAWADSLGGYDLYLPTASEGSTLESKLIDELRIEPLAQAA